jgi:hypothetical protein
VDDVLEDLAQHYGTIYQTAWDLRRVLAFLKDV